MEGNMSFSRLKIAGGIASLLFVNVSLSHSQDQWKWPDKPRNLQVMPKEWSGRQLSPVMKGFTSALGVRCTYCHVGEEGKPLSTYDFASDANPNKDRAREMYRMLGDINSHLKKIQPSGDKRVNMWCNTCHRGRPRPMTLEEELGEKYRMKGLDSALTCYVELKKRYYGTGPYNFGEMSLNNVGYELLAKDDVAGSIRVLKLNAEEFPGSANVWDSLAEAYMKAGDMTKAEEYYQKSLSLDANNDNAREMLKKIKEATRK
jgi:tetratricopeptide (TPR) repeat protein